MLIVMKPKCSADEIEAVNAKVRAMGLVPHPIPGA
jgi:hypothetical protein